MLNRLKYEANLSRYSTNMSYRSAVVREILSHPLEEPLSGRIDVINSKPNPMVIELDIDSDFSEIVRINKWENISLYVHIYVLCVY